MPSHFFLKHFGIGVAVVVAVIVLFAIMVALPGFMQPRL